MARKDEPLDAPFGVDLVGEDGRHVYSRVGETFARQEAIRIGTLTGEEFSVVASDPPNVPTPATASASE